MLSHGFRASSIARRRRKTVFRKIDICFTRQIVKPGFQATLEKGIGVKLTLKANKCVYMIKSAIFEDDFVDNPHGLNMRLD